MAGFCSICGGALQAGGGFCGQCGAAQTSAGGPPPTSKGSSLPWVIAVLAVLLLGIASGYILLLKQQEATDESSAPTASTVPQPTPTNAAPEGTPPVALPNAALPPSAPAVAPVPATITSGGIGGGTDQPIGSYTAYIGREDLFASDGVRLTQPWQILRQDRANVHRFGIRQSGDSGDGFFASANNRAAMERMVMQGRISPAAARAIVSGGSMVQVTLYGTGDSVRYLDIRVN